MWLNVISRATRRARALPLLRDRAITFTAAINLIIQQIEAMQLMMRIFKSTDAYFNIKKLIFLIIDKQNCYSNYFAIATQEDKWIKLALVLFRQY